MSDESAEPSDELWYVGDHDGGDPESARRTRRVALIGLAVVLVIATLAITFAALVDTSGLTAPRNPQATAQRWGQALLARDSGRRHSLECSGSRTAEIAALVLPSASAVHATAARPTGADRWEVPLEVRAADGRVTDTLPLTVVRRGGRYLVC